MNGGGIGGSSGGSGEGWEGWWIHEWWALLYFVGLESDEQE